MRYITLLMLLLLAPLAHGATTALETSPDGLRIVLAAKTAELAKTQERLAQVREALAEERLKVAALEKRLAALEKARMVPAAVHKTETGGRVTSNTKHVAKVGKPLVTTQKKVQKPTATSLAKSKVKPVAQKTAPSAGKDVLARLQDLWPKGVPFDLKRVSFDDVKRGQGGLVAGVRVGGKPLTNSDGKPIVVRGDRLEELALVVHGAKS